MNRLVWAKAGLCVVSLLAVTGAGAQTVYRSVGADGRVTFSDKASANAELGKVAGSSTSAAAGASNSDLPFELRQVVSRYPVTLYSAPDCGPCASGRAMLGSRGVPFAERSVTTSDDIASLQRISGENSLPVLTIGSQRIKGYSDQEWTQYLDAAGYPKSSILPSGYRQAPASPLVAVVKPAAKAEAEAKAEPQPVAAPQGPGPANPAGIKF